MDASRNSRFASFDEDGTLNALVADGLPDYPADGNLSSLTDDQVGELHAALVDSVTALPDDATPEDINVLADRITALRDEAATRMAATDPADPPADDPTVTDPPADPPASDPTLANDRQAALDRLAGLSADPNADPTIPGTLIEGMSAETIATAVTAGVTAAAPALVEAALAARTPALPRRHGSLSARDLGDFTPGDRTPGPGAGEPSTTPAHRGQLVAAGDITGMAMGQSIDSIEDLTSAMRSRWDSIGRTTGGHQDEKVVVATLKFADSDIDDSRDLRGLTNTADRGEVKRRIRMVLGKDAMGVDPWTLEAKPIGRGGIAIANPEGVVASGGLAAPVEPYYPQLHVGQAAMPTFDAIPGFVADRGGIRLVSPASLNTLATATVVGQFTDGDATGSSETFTSATADFTASDVGQPIVQIGGSTVIPVGTIISAVGSTTSVTLSNDATISQNPVTFRLPSRNPNNLGPAVGLVTAAQDAAGPPNVIKFTYDVPDGTQLEHDVYSVYTSLQFANLTARTFPEQVELNILLANDLAARISEQAALDYITTYSTLITAAKTFGTARQLLAQLEHQAAYLRNSLRMDPMAVVRLGLPAWSINAMRGDYISSFIGGGDNWGLSDDELMSWFQERALLPFFYQDGPSDISQLFPVIGSGAINSGANTATPVALPDYPGQGSSTSFRTKIVSFMWPEGTWLGLTTGELNIGLVRDSILNSQNRFRNFEEKWVTPAFVGSVGSSLRTVHTVASDGSYGAAATVVLGAGSGL